MDENRALISDGCPRMVGWKGGIHAWFEKLRGKRYQRVICFFHHIELSFKVILVLYLVISNSPDKLAGPIRVALGAGVHKLPITTFKILPNPSLLQLIDSIPTEVFKFSNDHKILKKLSG